MQESEARRAGPADLRGAVQLVRTHLADFEPVSLENLGEPAADLAAMCDMVDEVLADAHSWPSGPWDADVAELAGGLRDVGSFLGLLVASRPAPTGVEARRLRHIVHGLFMLVTRLRLRLRAAGFDNPDRSDVNSARRLAAIAAAYREDAQRERSAMWLTVIAGAVLTLGGICTIVVGLVGFVDSSTVEPGQSDGPDWSLYLAFLTAAGIALVVAALTFLQAERQRKAVDEATRLSRQFEALEPYLEPMHPATRDILRASLTSRLFAKSIWDDDPLKEPIWPTTGQVLKSLRTRHPRSVRRSSEGETSVGGN